jgi:hypothetical protein
MKAKQKNDILASKTSTMQQRDFSNTANDTCEENLVYLRIWSIGNNLPSNYPKNELLLPHSIIAQSLSQDYCVTCIVSKVWKWQRIQEEIMSTLKQHLGSVPLRLPQNSFHLSYFYHCSKDESQPQSIPLPTLAKLDVNKISEDNSSIIDPIEKCITVEGDFPSLPSFKLYPILHRMDFWNAIHPYESIGSNAKWSVDMIVLCSPIKKLGRIQRYDQNSQKINVKGSIPMKVEDTVGKSKYVDTIHLEQDLVINSINKQDKGKKQRRSITSKSSRKVETDILATRNDKHIQCERNNCEDHIGLIELRSTEISEASRSHVMVQNVREESNPVSCKVQDSREELNAIKNKKQRTELCSTRRENTEHDEQHSNLECTVASRHALLSLEDHPFSQLDSTSILKKDNNSLEVGQVPGSVCTQRQECSLGTNDKEGPVIPLDDHKETDTDSSETSSIPKHVQTKKAGNEKHNKTLASVQHDLKATRRHFTTTVSHHNPDGVANVKISKERNKKTVTEAAFFIPYDVICYPKRAALQNIGNRRLEILVEMAASHYNTAMDNAARSKVVNSVVAIIHEAGGKFFRWCQVRGYVIASPFLACLTVREKFDEALVFRGRPSQERSLYQILKVHDDAKT